MDNASLPPRVDATLMHALCRSAWSEAVDVGVARRILLEQLVQPDDSGAVNLTPLFNYLAAAGLHGASARCAREVAEALESEGIASYVLELVLRRGAPRAAPPLHAAEKPRALGTRVLRANPASVPLFACLLALLAAGCFVLQGG